MPAPNGPFPVAPAPAGNPLEPAPPATAELRVTDVQIARLLNEPSPDVDALRRALEQALDQRDEAREAVDRIGAEVRGVTKW